MHQETAPPRLPCLHLPSLPPKIVCSTRLSPIVAPSLASRAYWKRMPTVPTRSRFVGKISSVKLPASCVAPKTLSAARRTWCRRKPGSLGSRAWGRCRNRATLARSGQSLEYASVRVGRPKLGPPTQLPRRNQRLRRRLRRPPAAAAPRPSSACQHRRALHWGRLRR